MTQARAICERCAGDAPEVCVVGDTDITFTYVPHHLHYMMLELLKNSLRATVEHHSVSIEDGVDLPPVVVVLARGKHDITIKVSDRGGGIAFTETAKVCVMHTLA